MTPLRPLLLDTRDGEWGKGEPAGDRIKMRVIRGTDFADVRQGQVTTVPTRYLERRHADRKRLQAWDIIIETAGGSPDKPTGRTILVTPRTIELLGQDITCASFARFLRVDPQRACPEYLFWLLQHHYERRDLLQFHTQHTGVARFQFTTFSNTFEFSLPPLETQRRIAAILGAYDDLIEVNRRRVAVLEEMARGLFEEWFVRFRFPGHEQVPLLETPNGSLPQGWVSQPVGETFEMLGGGTPSKTIGAYWEAGSVDWYTPTDLTGAKTMFMDRSATRITEVGLAKSSAKLFPADSIMMTSRATIGAIAINTGPACTNQGFITCLPNERVPRSYLFYWLHQNVPVFIGHATGATFKEITKGVFKRLPIVMPSSDLARSFESQVRPMHDMILALERSNRALAASRDLLLPRLISGQLTLKAAERELENAA